MTNCLPRRPPQIISPYHLYLNPKLVVQHYEIWRLVTNFLYFRKMGMSMNDTRLLSLVQVQGVVKFGRMAWHRARLLMLCRFIA